jgi:protease-4
MKDFLKTTLAAVIGTLLAVGILIAILGTQLMDPPRADLQDRLVLVLDDQVAFTEAGAPGSLAGMLGAGAPSTMPLHRLIEAIDRASRDGRVEAILLLDGGPILSGWGAQQEVYEAMQRFGAAGKSIVAYAADYGMGTYWLAALADPVVMPSLGVFDFSGLGVELQYFPRAMEKFGVEMQVTRVGRYKSAVEPFLEEGPSEADREQWMALLGSLQDDMLADIGGARGIDVVTLQGLVQEPGLLSASAALEAGLVDRIASFEDVIEMLQGEVGSGPDEGGYDLSGTFAQVGLRRYLEEEDEGEPDWTDGTVAVVFAEGPIVDGWAEDALGGDRLAAELRSLRLDPSVEAVVLRIDSPGGSAAASEVILREVQLLREAGTPVVASMGSVAASGGYWIACQADRILAQPTTITGSIGVFGMFPNLAGLLDKVGVNVVAVQTGPHADLMSLARPKSEAELELLQEYVDEIYRGFLTRVAAGRGISEEEVDAIGEGRVWTGRQALELGLIDRFGGLEEAVAEAAVLAGLEDYDVDYSLPVSDGFEALVDEFLAPEDAPVVRLAPELEALRELGAELGLAEMLELGRRRGVQARLPYAWRVR